MFKSGRPDVDAFRRANGFALTESMWPYCSISFDCVNWKPEGELSFALFDLSALSGCLAGGVSFSFARLAFLEVSFPAVLLDVRLVLRCGVLLETLRAFSPSEICGLPWVASPAVLIFEASDADGGDTSKICNEEEEGKKSQHTEPLNVMKTTKYDMHLI